MVFDIPHMIATAVILLAILWAVDHAAMFDGMSKRRRTVLKFAAIFVAMLVLNTLWPYGSTA